MTFYRRPSETVYVCFRRVSRREVKDETDKSSCVLIVTCLQKLSAQWVKYALGCVYTDLPIGESKKKKWKRLSSFIRHNSAVWRLLVFFLVASTIQCDFSRLFFNVKLYLYQETISLTQKVLAWERKVEIKTSTSFEN